MFTCLECECFIPEKEQLPYFMEQLIEWDKKVEIFKGIESINRMAQKNSGLFHNVINRLERGGSS